MLAYPGRGRYSGPTGWKGGKARSRVFGFLRLAGVVMGFFNDAEHAQLCAHKIAATPGEISQVCGSQLSVPL